jgi:hypothetical protein
MEGGVAVEEKPSPSVHTGSWTVTRDEWRIVAVCSAVLLTVMAILAGWGILVPLALAAIVRILHRNRVRYVVLDAITRSRARARHAPSKR